VLIVAYLQFGGKGEEIAPGEQEGCSPWGHVMCALMALLQITGFILALLLNIFYFNDHIIFMISLKYC